MPDPTIEAAKRILEESLEGMRGAVVGLPPEALGWRPASQDTNPIVVLVTHAMHSTRWWLSISLAAQTPERDRPSEFLATADSGAELLSFFDAMANDCRALLETEDAFHAGARRKDPRQPDEPVTAAWALLHALEHLQEHVGHAQLTRQLWEQRA